MTESNRLLNASIDTTNRITANLQDQIDSVKSSSARLAKSVSDLEKVNAKVKDYLDTVIPPELVRVYSERKNSLRPVGSSKPSNDVKQ